MRILEAYRDGQHIGQFVRIDNRIEFRYDSPDAAIPISLSLPPGTPHTRRAAERVLENLLPDNPAVREAWARTLEVPNTGFDLLERLGEDVAGALTIMPEGTSPDATAAPVRPASDDEIADRILAIRQRPEAWMDPAHLGERRMSLAGAQGKFALLPGFAISGSGPPRSSHRPISSNQATTTFRRCMSSRLLRCNLPAT